MNVLRAYLSTLVALTLAGCGSTRSALDAGSTPEDRTKSGFPTKEALGELSEAPPLALDADRTLDVDTWSLEGPFPDRPGVTPIAGDSPWSKLLLEALAPKAGLVVASNEMACTARELGRFHLAHGEHPSPSLRSFIQGRCGAAVVGVSSRSLSAEVPESMSDEQIFEHYRGDVAKMLGDLGSGPGSVGLWFGRDAKKVVFLLASGVRRTQVMEVERSAEAPGTVRLRGELLVPAESIRALVNHGRFGVAPCTAAPGVRLPRFDVTCAGDAADAEAWIELVSFPAGRQLGETALAVLYSPSGRPSDAFVRPRLAAELAIERAADIAPRLVDAVNAVRAEAALEPLALEKEESRVAGRVAPHYFAAALGREPATVADVVVLGLRAGWNVDGLVRQGGFTSGWSSRTGDLEAVLSLALERPFGRDVLLDPDARRIAVGAVWNPAESFLGTVVSTYQLFTPTPGGALREVVMKRIDAVRGSAGRRPARDWQDLGALEEAVTTAIASGELSPHRALDRMLTQAAAKKRTRVLGWVMEARALETLDLPDELVTPGDLTVAVAVAPYRPEGEPWGRYAVIIVVEAAAPEVTAEARDADRTPRALTSASPAGGSGLLRRPGPIRSGCVARPR